MKVGIFGGTFDPPHRGHTQLASFILKEKNLDKIIFVPANRAPYTDKNPTASFAHRLEMTRLAIGEDERFELSDVEGERGGNSYTIETIRHFSEKHHLEKDDIVLIIGSDSLKRFGEWKSPDAIIEESTVLVLRRETLVRDDFDKRFFDRVEFLENELIEISSSKLRSGIQSTNKISEYISQDVLNYITENNLYSL